MSNLENKNQTYPIVWYTQFMDFFDTIHTYQKESKNKQIHLISMDKTIQTYEHGMREILIGTLCQYYTPDINMLHCLFIVTGNMMMGKQPLADKEQRHLYNMAYQKAWDIRTHLQMFFNKQQHYQVTESTIRLGGSRILRGFWSEYEDWYNQDELNTSLDELLAELVDFEESTSPKLLSEIQADMADVCMRLADVENAFDAINFMEPNIKTHIIKFSKNVLSDLSIHYWRPGYAIHITDGGTIHQIEILTLNQVRLRSFDKDSETLLSEDTINLHHPQKVSYPTYILSFLGVEGGV